MTAHGFRIRFHGALLGFALAAGTACTSAGGAPSTGEAGARGDSRTITEAELLTATQLNLYDYVAAERPRWVRSSTSMSRTPLLVFVADTRLGGVQTLKTLTTGTVRMVRYYDASAAQQKFPGRDIGPVIQVFMK
jgi:hypothetical protein